MDYGLPMSLPMVMSCNRFDISFSNDIYENSHKKEKVISEKNIKKCNTCQKIESKFRY